MSRLFSSPRLWILFLLALAALGGSGCSSTDTEGLSERPWNTPKGWETGLPSTMNEGR